MAKSKGEQIKSIAKSILEQHPAGVTYSDLVRKVGQADTKLNMNTVRGNVWDLAKGAEHGVYLPERGLYRLEKFRDHEGDGLEPSLIQPTVTKVKEEEFYQPFAEWIVRELEECTDAVALGGAVFKDKWGTPDVIGKRESSRSDIIQAPVEIVSAEIKPDAQQLITAFGQACAYCLFSHKTYLVVPATAPPDELARLDGLCRVFGIGLVLFDSEQPDDPRFSIRCRARLQEPDLFYTNRYLKRIESKLFR